MKVAVVLSLIVAAVSGRLIDEQHLLAKEVCYDKYGCFSTEAPWTSRIRSLSALPVPPYETGTRFILFTRGNEETEQIGYELLPDKDAILRFSDFDARRPTYFLIHGFTDSHKAEWVWNTKNQLLEKEDANIIAVDWEDGARWQYLQSTANARLVGAMIAHMINYLEQKAELKVEDIHIISHSLGAHVAGYAGNRLSGRIARITAIDPMDLYFGGTDPLVRLDTTDARFVEVIHSNADAWTNFGLGISDPIGHLDIYPNGGKKQPGCSDTLGSLIKEMLQLLTLQFSEALSTRACSHVRATHFYVESIDNKDSCAFASFPCKSYSDFEKGLCYQHCTEQGNCASFGHSGKTRTEASGTYYLHTTDGAKNRTYCKQIVQLQIPISLTQEQTVGSLTLTVKAEDGSSEKFKLADNVKLSPGQILQQWVEIPQYVLKSPNDKPNLVLRYTRRGLLQSKTLQLDAENLVLIKPDLSSMTIAYEGVTLETGKDSVITN